MKFDYLISGRFFSDLNNVCLPYVYHFLGGDKALVLSEELPEDMPELGRTELQGLSKDYERVIFFGMCIHFERVDLSAPVRILSKLCLL